MVPVAGAATLKPITGKLDARGYEVLAVGQNGATSIVEVASSGKFSIVPPAKDATLHLRKDGQYSGPIVVRSSTKSRVTMGLRAGAKLGKIDVRAGRRMAMVLASQSSSEVNRSLWASARKGTPVGASGLGLIRVSKVGDKQQPGQDADRDGLINAFDVDDDGDKTLDNVDDTFSATGSSSGSRASAYASGTAKSFHVFSNLKLSIDSSINANFSSMTKAEIDAVTAPSETLAVEVVAGDSVELDCGGLSYCSNGGTGAVVGGGALQFPEDYDADADGHGTIAAGATGDFQLQTGGGALDVRSGDSFIERSTTASVETLVPGMLAYDFTSTPALVSWSDDSSVSTTSISYPVLPGGTGTMSNPYTVQADSSGNVMLTYTMWRPQRPRIHPSEARWTDIGGLAYSVDLPNAPGGGAGGPGLCGASTYSESDASLSVGSSGLDDASADRAADPANTLTYTVNMTSCLGATTWDVGETLQVDLQARSNDGDNAAQKVWFVRTA